MGKNKRKQISCFDEFHNVEVQCDSVEECDFIQWCSEMAQMNLIYDFIYQPESIKLFDKVDYIAYDGKKKFLFREHIYSPDFIIQINPKTSQILCKELKIPYEAMNLESFSVYLDVKGTFQKSDGGRSFSLNQKWVYQKTGIYVMKLIPKDFFQKCGCPSNCFLTQKTKKPRKIYAGMKSIQQIFTLDTQEDAQSLAEHSRHIKSHL